MMGRRGCQWRYINPNDSLESEYEALITGTSSNDAVLASRNTLLPMAVVGDFHNVFRAKFDSMECYEMPSGNKWGYYEVALVVVPPVIKVQSTVSAL
jgi:hypothetical protein